MVIPIIRKLYGRNLSRFSFRSLLPFVSLGSSRHIGYGLNEFMAFISNAINAQPGQIYR